MHAHPANVIAMTHTHELDDREFSKTLWRTCTECICVFPKGVSVVPWMVSSTANIGLQSAEKFKYGRAGLRAEISTTMFFIFHAEPHSIPNT